MIKGVKLSDFRNFKKKILVFSDKITVIIGPNASGKTNVLEALFLLSTGKSFKARTEAEMLRYEQELARVIGKTETIRLESVITKGDNGWPKKKLFVNGVPKRLIDFAGGFKTVLFGPWDMDLVTESPSLRRKFLDNVLSQVDREYRRCILSYEKGLRQRNRLLFRIREEGAPRSQLLFWNQLLIKTGDYITSKRQEFIDFANSQPSLNDQKFKLEYDRSVISEGRLEQYRDEEVSAATTLVGPHRDDMQFKINNSKFTIERDLAAYGSRGEQRMGVLWLKIAELEFIEAKMGERPTLLLDDIFSELDHEHRDVVMRLAKSQQTIITTADEHFLKGLRPDVTIKL
jgi:DNA replication and repair protein RecF